jgi:hypothetical protein
MGHEDALPQPRLSARCWFSQRTFVGTQGNGREAPNPAVAGSKMIRWDQPDSGHSLVTSLMILIDNLWWPVAITV